LNSVALIELECQYSCLWLITIDVSNVQIGGYMPHKEETDTLLRDLIERIEVLTKVVSIQVAADKSTTERARVLKLAGLDNQTIADVLNTSPGTVRTLTSNLRARGR
jgi:DNA-binding NarL/FixJ family response regulator